MAPGIAWSSTATWKYFKYRHLNIMNRQNMQFFAFGIMKLRMHADD